MNSVVPPVWYRQFVGVFRIVLGLLIASAVVHQVTDRLIHGVFRPGEYFAFFTIQTSMMNVVVLVVGGVYALSHTQDTKLLTIVRMNVVSFAVVTCVVYNLLLRSLPPEPGYVSPEWANELLHVWAPILLVLDWFFTPGRWDIRVRAATWVLVYPLVWTAFSLVRGSLTWWWPYPFLNPTEPAGVLGVCAYIVGIALFFYVTALAVTGFARLWNRSRAARVG